VKERVKSTKKFRFLVLLLVAILFAQNARAIPAGDNLLDDGLYDVTYSIGSGFAELDCEVYKYTSGVYTDKYVYTYQISNISSGIGLSFFSVGIKDGANAFDPDFDAIPGAVAPTVWDVVYVSYPPPASEHVKSVEALFTYTIDGGFGSVVLWFASDYASTLGNGVLFGMSSGTPYYATGDLLTPVPEPATLALLGIGGLMTLIRKRRFD